MANRLKRELKKRRIIFTEDEYMERTRYSNPGCEEELYVVTDEFIITVWSSQVTTPKFHIYDRNTYECIGGQEVYKDSTFGGSPTWDSWAITF